jgi:hypothetical protein
MQYEPDRFLDVATDAEHVVERRMHRIWINSVSKTELFEAVKALEIPSS